MVRAQALLAARRLTEAEPAVELVRSGGDKGVLYWTMRAEIGRARKNPAAALDAARAAVAADPLDVPARQLLRASD